LKINVLRNKQGISAFFYLHIIALKINFIKLLKTQKAIKRGFILFKLLCAFAALVTNYKKCALFELHMQRNFKWQQILFP
jgi:hypothetical protein